jgi:hypothetical protein
MMRTDEIRGRRIGVMRFPASGDTGTLKARRCLSSPDSRGPFYCPPQGATRVQWVSGASNAQASQKTWSAVLRVLCSSRYHRLLAVLRYRAFIESLRTELFCLWFWSQNLAQKPFCLRQGEVRSFGERREVCDDEINVLL